MRHQFPILLFFSVLLLLGSFPCDGRRAHRRKSTWRRRSSLRELAASEVVAIGQLNNRSALVEHIDRIGVVRVPDTPGHAVVLGYIEDTLESLGWVTERDVSTQSTPLGTKTFTNIMATRYPLDYNSQQRVVIAAHYDSKFYDNINFVGAIDSAAPCAILLDLARSLEDFIQPDDPTVVQLVFFDGEEAFVRWSGTDNTYGSRNLASVWEDEGKLDTLQLFILLDLLGAPRPQLRSFFDNTLSNFRRMQQIEALLDQEGVLGPTHTQPYFVGKSSNQIQDDHIPFLQRNVPIVHLIASPFPGVWHSASDTVENLDIDSVMDLASIMRVVAVELSQSENVTSEGSGARRLRHGL